MSAVYTIKEVVVPDAQLGQGGRQTLARQRALDHIRERITRQPPGQTLFVSEGEIASALGISRTPVREAFARLEAERLLTIMPGRGAMIEPVWPREVNEVMEARSVLELFAVRKVIEDGLDLREPLDAALDAQRASEDPSAFIALDREFHEVWIKAAGNSVITDLYRSLRDRQQRHGVVAIMSRQNRTDEVLAEHLAIRDGLVHLDAANAETAVNYHLSTTLEVLLSSPWLHHR